MHLTQRLPDIGTDIRMIIQNKHVKQAFVVAVFVNCLERGATMMWPYTPPWPWWSPAAAILFLFLVCHYVYGWNPKAVPQPLTSKPDWSMHALFGHLGDVCADRNGLPEKIESQARLGNLACWGRKYSSASAKENTNPLRPIPMGHWDDFTLDFLQCRWSEDPGDCRTQPRSDRFKNKHADSFQDLRVNKSEAMALWPDSNRNVESTT